MACRYDIEFEGRKYKKEDFVYYPHREPKKRMKYFSAFWNLVKKEKGFSGKEWRKGRLYNATREFLKYFNKLYRKRKKEQKPITWDDFKNWSAS